MSVMQSALQMIIKSPVLQNSVLGLLFFFLPASKYSLGCLFALQFMSEDTRLFMTFLSDISRQSIISCVLEFKVRHRILKGWQPSGV